MTAEFLRAGSVCNGGGGCGGSPLAQVTMEQMEAFMSHIFSIVQACFGRSMQYRNMPVCAGGLVESPESDMESDHSDESD